MVTKNGIAEDLSVQERKRAREMRETLERQLLILCIILRMVYRVKVMNSFFFTAVASSTSSTLADSPLECVCSVTFSSPDSRLDVICQLSGRLVEVHLEWMGRRNGQEVESTAGRNSSLIRGGVRDLNLNILSSCIRE